jgi:hypothetical protein
MADAFIGHSLTGEAGWRECLCRIVCLSSGPRSRSRIYPTSAGILKRPNSGNPEFSCKSQGIAEIAALLSIPILDQR